MVSFGGQQGMRLRHEMTLQELNQALQGLTFVFKDSHWFGPSFDDLGVGITNSLLNKLQVFTHPLMGTTLTLYFSSLHHGCR